MGYFRTCTPPPERAYANGVDALQTTPHKADAEPGRALDRTDPDRSVGTDLRISVWVRWFVVIAWLVQLHYRVNFAHPAYVAHTLFALLALALNAYVHYRIESGRTVTWHWAAALSVMDGGILTAALVISGGFSNTFFVSLLPLSRHVCRGVHVLQAQLRRGHRGRGHCTWR